MNTSTDAFEVQGFMPAAGLAILRDLAADKRVLEIGCWKGRTALAMAAVANCVWTVDHFRGDAYTGKAYTLPEAWENLRAAGNVRVLAGPFEEIMLGLDLAWFEVLFYDADHDYEPTRRFLELAVERSIDATLVVDDYSPAYPQVMQAVHEFFPARSIRVEGALAILRKRP